MSHSYASISASLLARKGEAKPSQEPTLGSKPWQPPVVPAAPPAAAATPAPPGAAKVKLQEVAAMWPAAKGQPAHEAGEWTPARPRPELQLSSLGQPIRTTVRLTHAQARAVKLAALVLDRPQQEILTGGLLAKLEALACADLASCACFRAVIEGLKAPDPLAEPPLAY